jgi:ABC-type amino acid transport substrate-binding protein
MQTPKSKPPSLFAISMSVAVLSMIVSLSALYHRNAVSNQVARQSALSRIKQEGILRVGYSGFSPYTIIDPKEPDPEKRVKGFAADVVNEIASRSVPKLKVEWHIFTWDTLRTDMLSKKFDFIADPVYQTIPKALEFSYTEPYSYFGIALGVVRKNEKRFKDLQDLDHPDITLVLAEGWVSSDFAREHLKDAKFRFIPAGSDAFVQLDDVLLGRADAALQDSPSAVQYAKAHPDKIKVLWVDHPPSIAPGGFSVRHEDNDLRDFLNTSIRVLKADGTMSRLDKKWKTYGYFQAEKFEPAEGLKEYLQSEQHKHEL